MSCDCPDLRFAKFFVFICKRLSLIPQEAFLFLPATPVSSFPKEVSNTVLSFITPWLPLRMESLATRGVSGLRLSTEPWAWLHQVRKNGHPLSYLFSLVPLKSDRF